MQASDSFPWPFKQDWGGPQVTFEKTDETADDEEASGDATDEGSPTTDEHDTIEALDVPGTSGKASAVSTSFNVTAPPMLNDLEAMGSAVELQTELESTDSSKGFLSET